jgi:hypothetical protein
VNVKLLLKRPKRVDLPDDLIDLVKVCQENRSHYLSLDGKNSIVFDLLMGTVQGSVLEPLLYAIFLSPLFDMVHVLSFVDDSYKLETNSSKVKLVRDMGKSLELITKWLRKSGIKGNQEKTDLFIFFKNEAAAIKINLGGAIIKSRSEINVLGGLV